MAQRYKKNNFLIILMFALGFFSVFSFVAAWFTYRSNLFEHHHLHIFDPSLISFLFALFFLFALVILGKIYPKHFKIAGDNMNMISNFIKKFAKNHSYLSFFILLLLILGLFGFIDYLLRLAGTMTWKP